MYINQLKFVLIEYVNLATKLVYIMNHALRLIECASARRDNIILSEILTIVFPNKFQN